MRLDHGDDALDEVHEINVTPFIDVMLVLLIIFMVAAPLATVDIKVNLPAVSAEPQPRPDGPLYLTISLIFPLRSATNPSAASTCPARSTQPPRATRTGPSTCALTRPCHMVDRWRS